MTTILPPTELAFFRSIAKTAAVLLICLRIDELNPGRAIADHEIADILEVDPRTVTKQLRSLSAYGLVLEQRENKYVVTPLGRNTLFANRQSATLSIEEGKEIDGEPFPRTQCVPHELIDDESESNHDLEIDSSSSVIESANCAQVLEATHLLFGTPVNTSGITDRNAEHALAWISKAYADRRKLNNPQGLVYSRLRDNARPPVYLLKDPTQGLPDEYLIAIGRMEAQPDEPESDEAEDGPVDEEPDPIPESIKDAYSKMAAHILNTVGKGKLYANICSLWTPLRYTVNVLFIRVPVKEQVEWAYENASAVIEPLLQEFTGEQIIVKFVVR